MSGTGVAPRRAAALLAMLGGNPPLLVGIALLGGLLLFSGLGHLLYDTTRAEPLSVMVAEPPSVELLFGSDALGRDLLAVMIAGTALSMKVGLIAGLLGVAFGTLLAFLAAFHGGWTDRIISAIVDVLLTVPGLMVLIVLAASLPGQINTTTMALVIASLAWREPTRQIRAQALVMREAQYVRMARISGAGDLRIILSEMMPNLLPYLGACLVGAVSGAMLSSVGLEALGLGSRQEPTLGMTIYWMMLEGAFLRAMWWWILAPIVVLVILFVGLYMLSIGLDEFANPRLRGER